MPTLPATIGVNGSFWRVNVLKMWMPLDALLMIFPKKEGCRNYLSIYQLGNFLLSA
jgi:hypothetical protein